MNIKFLGTADSGGIPSHNCTCSICSEYQQKGLVTDLTHFFSRKVLLFVALGGCRDFSLCLCNGLCSL